MKVRILKLYGTDLVRYPDLDLALFCIFVILNMFTSFLYSDKLLIIFYSHWNIVRNLYFFKKIVPVHVGPVR